jgi:rhodanese-related sulfurtransferase
MTDAVPAIDAHVDALRATYDRLDPLAAARAVEDGALLVDIRPFELRQLEGEVPGALIIDRNVLEWRLTPSSPHRHEQLAGADQTVIIMCSEGYASTLAAATLRSLGLPHATDLVGGFRAWRAKGLPTTEPR